MRKGQTNRWHIVRFTSTSVVGLFITDGWIETIKPTERKMKTQSNKVGKIGLTVCCIALGMVFSMMGRSEASSQSLSPGGVESAGCGGQSSAMTRWKTGIPRCRHHSPITSPVQTVKRDFSVCGEASPGITTWKSGVPRCRRDSPIIPPVQMMAKSEVAVCGETSSGFTTWKSGAPRCR